MRVYSDSTSGGGLLDCVIIDISIPGFGCVDFLFRHWWGQFYSRFFCGISFTCFSGMGCWWFFLERVVHISGYEVVDRLFFRASFFFRCRIVAGQKQKGPKKSIKRERFLIQFLPSLLRHIFLLDHIFLLRHI